MYFNIKIKKEGRLLYIPIDQLKLQKNMKKVMNDLELTRDHIIMRDLGNNIYFTMIGLMLVEDAITKKLIWDFISISNRIIAVPSTCRLYNILKLAMI